ncbi:SWIB-domain-containing protein [Delitschia confertaspora ATCC 74209]|uniref:SWIB-domain-containing protein n=1 Tax=Delitschia confertaspora ATCC 74209 TaxID=1513339 RepID=A0A9P4MP30_9PLEO|nr:SWIB-domain-containing protein [Delitschia confertaspora ATCC 74209]
MSALPPEVEASYAAIIDDILAASDLNTISAKRIRKGLQEKVDYDISHQKDQVTALIMARFDKFNNEANGHNEAAPAESAEALPTVEVQTTNGASAPAQKASENGSVSTSPKKRSPDDESELSEVQSSPPKKKQKKTKSVEEDDATLAARLQAEENLRSRARSTRGGNTKKKAPLPKKKQKKKSAAKIKGEDDSDVESGSGAEKKEVKRTGGFHKPMNLSPALSELLGETSLSRPQTVKKIWEYVKSHDLQDPSDKRQIRCDEPMRAVFKQDRVHMFTMNKILNQNLYAQDE